MSSRVGAHRGAPAKVVSVNRSSTPGPGSYNASTVLTNSRASSAVFRSHTHGLHTREGVPGPGTHDISYETRFPSGRSHSMSSADRFKQRPNNTPGPGAFIKVCRPGERGREKHFEYTLFSLFVSALTILDQI